MEKGKIVAVGLFGGLLALPVVGLVTARGPAARQPAAGRGRGQGGFRIEAVRWGLVPSEDYVPAGRPGAFRRISDSAIGQNSATIDAQVTVRNTGNSPGAVRVKIEMLGPSADPLLIGPPASNNAINTPVIQPGAVQVVNISEGVPNVPGFYSASLQLSDVPEVTVYDSEFPGVNFVEVTTSTMFAFESPSFSVTVSARQPAMAGRRR